MKQPSQAKIGSHFTSSFDLDKQDGERWTGMLADDNVTNICNKGKMQQDERENRAKSERQWEGQVSITTDCENLAFSCLPHPFPSKTG